MRYTANQLNFLRKKCPRLSIPDLTAAFNQRFGTNKMRTAIKSAMSNHKIRSGRPKGNPKGTFRKFTPEQAQFIRVVYKRLSLPDLTKALNARFRIRKTIWQLRAFTRNHRITSGRTGYFAPGQKPWNAGTRGMGICKANRGSYQKGNIPGNIRPTGAERVDTKDGYLLVKVAERDPHTGAATRFKAKHVVLWERKHGKVPPGMAVVFRDGRKDHCTIKNLMLVTRAELLQMNRLRYREMPDELKPSLLLLGKLKLKVGARRRG